MACRVLPYEGKEPHLFLNSSPQDADLVNPILEQLAKDSYRVWFDDGRHPEEDRLGVLSEQVKKSSLCLAMVSKASCDSHNCRSAVNLAIELGKPLIFVVLEPFSMSLATRLQLGAFPTVRYYEYTDAWVFFGQLYTSAALGACYGPGMEQVELDDQPSIRPTHAWNPRAGKNMLKDLTEEELAILYHKEWYDEKLRQEREKWELEKKEQDKREQELQQQLRETREALEQLAKDAREREERLKAAMVQLSQDAQAREDRLQEALEQAQQERTQRENQLNEQLRREQQKLDDLRRAAADQAQQRKALEDRIEELKAQENQSRSDNNADRENLLQLRRQLEEERKNLDQTIEQRLRDEREAMQKILDASRDREREFQALESKVLHLQQQVLQARQEKKEDDRKRQQAKPSGEDKKVALEKAAVDPPKETPQKEANQPQPEGKKHARGLLLSIRDGIYYPIREAVTRFGRVAQNNDLVFPHDTNMSRSHAELLCETYDTYLRDVGSSNGTWVNGIRLAAYERVRLSSCDLLQMGGVELVYVAEGEANLISRTDQVDLLVRDGSEDYLLLSPYRELQLGRNMRMTRGILNDPAISRVHAKIWVSNGKVFVMDLNSSNGSRIDQQLLVPGRDYILKPQSMLWVGYSLLRYVPLQLKKEEVRK